MTTNPEPTFEQELEALINRYSQENASNTPDFILARYLVLCLTTFASTVEARERWYGRTHNVITSAAPDVTQPGGDA